MTKIKKQPPHEGLIPQSGDPQHPGRWIRPDARNGGAKKPSTPKPKWPGGERPPAAIGPGSPDWRSPDPQREHAAETFLSHYKNPQAREDQRAEAYRNFSESLGPEDHTKLVEATNQWLKYDVPLSTREGKAKKQSAWENLENTVQQLTTKAIKISQLRKLMKAVQDPFAVATATAQEMGYTDFSEGTEGREKRDEIAESIKEEKGVGRGELLAGISKIQQDLCG